jgi:hypothetical protein
LPSQALFVRFAFFLQLALALCERMLVFSHFGVPLFWIPPGFGKQ